jgi:hypothetical protein
MTFRWPAFILSLFVYTALFACSGEAPVSKARVKYDIRKVDSTICVINEKFRAHKFNVKSASGLWQDGKTRRFFLYIDNGDKSPLSVHNIENDGSLTIYVYDIRPVVNGKVVDIDSIILSLDDALNNNRMVDQDSIRCGY